MKVARAFPERPKATWTIACVAGGVGARLKFWRRSRVPKKGSRDEAVEISRGFAARDGSAVKSHSTILQRLRRQISPDHYTILPAPQATWSRVIVAPSQRNVTGLENLSWLI